MWHYLKLIMQIRVCSHKVHTEGQKGLNLISQ